MEHGWTQVRRRRFPAKRCNKGNETSFFVTNIPKGVTKVEFRRIFSQFGKMTDIYFGERNGKNGKNYDFIRFTDVTDAKDMETRMNGKICRNNVLEINIARHGRKAPITKPIIGNNIRKGPVHRNNGKGGSGFIDSRSYADVTRRKNLNEENQGGSNAQAPAISLIPDTMMERWIHKFTLIGEALSLDHLGPLPALMSIHSDKVAEVKYPGGMMALLSFSSTVAAKEFLENKNFSEITRSFGRILAPFNEIKDRVDTSCVKIGILTRWKKKLNEEVKVLLNGIMDTVGIVEYEDGPWFPFMFDKEKQPYVNEDYSSDNEQTEDETEEEGSDEEDGISVTDMNMLEEGEIIVDDKHGRRRY
ncbi:unnamed protein product [Lactuca virosa]|uniref:RRM domain-containing protein n=1 Tax=Lactuca virosa TaxID=75947 RepID=A0AAU9MM84_9ASTR|nr:unnamed protein product [Lactuca virosa]